MQTHLECGPIQDIVLGIILRHQMLDDALVGKYPPVENLIDSAHAECQIAEIAASYVFAHFCVTRTIHRTLLVGHRIIERPVVVNP